ncbi:MAG: BrnT family toxin [Deltaproteobacteria bacterium]|nr:BrnT family toxin [Deltaproteobacteria bacterium]
MELAWDEVKRRANYAKHGLDFRDAEKVFQGITLTAEDNRQDYGEKRLISLGLLEDMVVVVVHTARREKIRIISMRKANPGERKAYEEKIFFGLEAPQAYEG